MTKFTDGKRNLEIELLDAGTGIDWSADFYEVGGLPYDEETSTYTVDDCEYLVDQAKDLINGEGDFYDDGPNDSELRYYLSEEEN